MSDEKPAQYLRGKTHAEALFGIFDTRRDGVLTALAQVAANSVIDDSAGQQLDDLGALLGRERGALDDADYRVWLRAQILLNRSSGTVEQVIQILQTVTGGTVAIADEWPAGFTATLGVTALTEAQAVALYGIVLGKARAAGIRGLLHWFNVDPADSFTLDGSASQSLDVGIWSGALES